jgi:hypothetical protein
MTMETVIVNAAVITHVRPLLKVYVTVLCSILGQFQNHSDLPITGSTSKR